MALFKILKGDSSRIDMSITPFHDGYAYFTPDDGGFYIDSEDDGIQRRIRINPPVDTGVTTAVVSNETLMFVSMNDDITGVSVKGETLLIER